MTLSTSLLIDNPNLTFVLQEGLSVSEFSLIKNVQFNWVTTMKKEHEILVTSASLALIYATKKGLLQMPSFPVESSTMGRKSDLVLTLLRKAVRSLLLSVSHISNTLRDIDMKIQGMFQKPSLLARRWQNKFIFSFGLSSVASETELFSCMHHTEEYYNFLELELVCSLQSEVIISLLHSVSYMNEVDNLLCDNDVGLQILKPTILAGRWQCKSSFSLDACGIQLSFCKFLIDKHFDMTSNFMERTIECAFFPTLRYDTIGSNPALPRIIIVGTHRDRVIKKGKVLEEQTFLHDVERMLNQEILAVLLEIKVVSISVGERGGLTMAQLLKHNATLTVLVMDAMLHLILYPEFDCTLHTVSHIHRKIHILYCCMHVWLSSDSFSVVGPANFKLSV